VRENHHLYVTPGASSMGSPLMEMSDKRRARFGAVGGNLTPQQAKEQLTLPLYAIITGQSHAEFRGGSLSSPGYMVAIVSNSGGCLRSPDGRGLGTSIRVNCKQWETAVFPVLESPQFAPGSSSATFVASHNWTYYLTALGNAIAQSFSDAGYGPIDK